MTSGRRRSVTLGTEKAKGHWQLFFFLSDFLCQWLRASSWWVLRASERVSEHPCFLKSIQGVQASFGYAEYWAIMFYFSISFRLKSTNSIDSLRSNVTSPNFFELCNVLQYVIPKLLGHPVEGSKINFGLHLSFAHNNVIEDMRATLVEKDTVVTAKEC